MKKVDQDKVNNKGKLSPRVSLSLLSPSKTSHQDLHRKKGYTKVLQLGNTAAKTPESGYSGLKLPDIHSLHKKSVKGSNSQIKVQAKSPTVESVAPNYEPALEDLKDVKDETLTDDQPVLKHSLGQVNFSLSFGDIDESERGHSPLGLMDNDIKLHHNKGSVGVSSLKEEPVSIQQSSIDTAMRESFKTATATPKLPLDFKKKLSFDKEKLSSALLKMKHGPADKENPKSTHHKLAASGKVGTMLNNDNQELIPPSSAKPLEFDIHVSTGRERERDKHKKRKHSEKDVNSDNIKKSRQLSPTTSNNHHLTQSCGSDKRTDKMTLPNKPPPLTSLEQSANKQSGPESLEFSSPTANPSNHTAVDGENPLKNAKLTSNKSNGSSKGITVPVSEGNASKQSAIPSIKRPSTENKGAKRTARKTITKNKFSAEEKTLLEKYKSEQLKDVERGSTADRDSIDRNTSLILSTLTRRVQVDLTPACHNKLPPSTCHIVDNVPKLTEEPISEQTSKHPTSAYAKTSLESDKTALPHLSSTTNSTKELTSVTAESHKRPMGDAGFSIKSKVTKTNSQDGSTSVGAAFQSKVLDNFLKAAGINDTESSETVPMEATCSQAVSPSSHTSGPNDLKRRDGKEKLRWTKSLDCYVPKQRQEMDSNCTRHSVVSNGKEDPPQKAKVQNSLSPVQKSAVTPPISIADGAKLAATGTESNTIDTVVTRLASPVKEETNIAIVNVRSVADTLLEDDGVEISDKCYIPHSKTKLVGFYRFPNGSKIATVYKDGQLYCAAHELVIWLKISLGSLTQVKCSDKEAALIRMVGRGNLKENFEFKIVPLAEILEVLSPPPVGNDREVMKSNHSRPPNLGPVCNTQSSENNCSKIVTKVPLLSKSEMCQTLPPKPMGTDKDLLGSSVDLLSPKAEASSSISSLSTSTVSKLSAAQALRPAVSVSFTHASYFQVIHEPVVVTAKAVITTQSVMRYSANVSTALPLLTGTSVSLPPSTSTAADSLPKANQSVYQSASPICDIKSVSETVKSVADPVKSVPQTVESVPESVKSVPESVKSIPESVKSGPQTAMSGPETTKLGSETTKSGPETTKSRPETVKSMPATVNLIPGASEEELLPLFVLSPSSVSAIPINSSESVPDVAESIANNTNTNQGTEECNQSVSPTSAAVKSKKLRQVIDSYADLFADGIDNVRHVLEGLQPLSYIRVMHPKKLLRHTLKYKGRLLPNLSQFRTKTPFIVTCMGCGTSFSPLNFMMHLEDKDSAGPIQVADLLSECIVMDSAVVNYLDHNHVAFWNLFVDWFQLMSGELTKKKKANTAHEATTTTTTAARTAVSGYSSAGSSTMQQPPTVRDPFAELNKFDVPASPAPYNPAEEVTVERQQSSAAVSSRSQDTRTVQQTAVTLAHDHMRSQQLVQQPHAQQRSQVQQPRVQQPSVQQPSVQQPPVQQLSVQQFSQIQQPGQQVLQLQLQQAQIQQRALLQQPARQGQQHSGKSPPVHQTQTAAKQTFNQVIPLQQQVAFVENYTQRSQVRRANSYGYGYVAPAAHQTVSRRDSNSPSHSRATAHHPTCRNSQQIMAPPQNPPAVINNYRIQPAANKAAEHYQRGQYYQQSIQPHPDVYSSNTQEQTASLPAQISVTVPQHDVSSSVSNTITAATSSSNATSTASAHVERFNKAMVQQRMSMLSIEETFRCMEQDNASLRSQLTTERREKQDYAIKLQKALAESQSKDSEIQALREQLSFRMPR